MYFPINDFGRGQSVHTAVYSTLFAGVLPAAVLRAGCLRKAAPSLSEEASEQVGCRKRLGRTTFHAGHFIRIWPVEAPSLQRGNSLQAKS